MSNDLKRAFEFQASVEKNHRLGELLASVRPLDLNEWWPPHPTARLREGLSLRREDMYEERVAFPERTDSEPTGC